jgi:hypothetical protein
LWCELVLHGVGGKTIAEAQRNLAFSEVQKWAAFRQKRGTLNWGMRIERGFALLASMYTNAHRKKGTPLVSIHEFMPHADDPHERVMDLAEAQRTWR